MMYEALGPEGREALIMRVRHFWLFRTVLMADNA
jgi:hypothetical protein